METGRDLETRNKMHNKQGLMPEKVGVDDKFQYPERTGRNVEDKKNREETWRMCATCLLVVRLRSGLRCGDG